MPAISTGGQPFEPDAEGFVTFTVNVMEDGRRLPKQHDAKARVINLEGDFRLRSGGTSTICPRPSARCGRRILLGVGMMVVLGLLGGLILSRWMLNRLERINRTTRRIMAGDLGQRIRIDGHDDEFDELALNVNAMLERIERLLVGMRRSARISPTTCVPHSAACARASRWR